MTNDTGLLVLRAGASLMMMTHGYGKVVRLTQGQTEFADPLGLGAAPSLALAAFAEFFCSLAVLVGFKTRWAAVPVLFTMLVAALIVHAQDPWRKKEFALLYGVAFLALIIMGGGHYSLDGWLSKRKRRPRPSS